MLWLGTKRPASSLAIWADGPPSNAIPSGDSSPHQHIGNSIVPSTVLPIDLDGGIEMCAILFAHPSETLIPMGQAHAFQTYFCER